jgi:ABC-2 type transport system ATP-binding protein
MILAMNTPLLEIRDLRKNYGRFEVLSGLSFAVQPGECHGLLGPNGAGKTTLLSILACLSEATTGSVLLQGKTLSTRDRELRPLIGIAPQEISLYRDLSAVENLRFFGKLYGLSGATLHQRIDEGIELAGLQAKANAPVGTFSGGMQRRLNLSVAVVHRPQLLLLDEPTTGVDPQSRNHIFERVRDLNREGMTILYTSHYMEEVQTLCSRIAILDAGKLIACDSLPNLLKLQAGLLRLHFSSDPTLLKQRLETDSRLRGVNLEHHALSIQTPDISSVLTQIVGQLPELGLTLTRIESEEPNLERVFLHLTQRTLRD